MKKENSTEKTKLHFDNIAASYDESSDGRFCAHAYESLKNEVEKFNSGKLLDVSCGTGAVLSLLQHSSLEKYGVDFSEKMIEEARNNIGEDAKLYVASAETMPFAESTFDVVTCSFAFHHYIQPTLFVYTNFCSYQDHAFALYTFRNHHLIFFDVQPIRRISFLFHFSLIHKNTTTFFHIINIIKNYIIIFVI